MFYCSLRAVSIQFISSSSDCRKCGFSRRYIANRRD